MKKTILLILMFATVFLMCGCHRQKEENITATGYPSHEIQQPQIMYNDQVYFYFATGFDAPLPNGYTYVGKIQVVDNTSKPEINFQGARVELNQEIYANETSSDVIYVKYEHGFAEFKIR